MPEKKLTICHKLRRDIIVLWKPSSHTWYLVACVPTSDRPAIELSRRDCSVQTSYRVQSRPAIELSPDLLLSSVQTSYRAQSRPAMELSRGELEMAQ